MLECLLYLCIWAILALICWIVLQKVLFIFWGGEVDSKIMQLIGLLFGLVLLIQTLTCMGFLGRIFPRP